MNYRAVNSANFWLSNNLQLVFMKHFLLFTQGI
ncbi:MAG: hypothetical protein ACI8Q1_003066, partial [Parvicella sp.]